MNRKPNIVFVFADDWGWGDLSCFGHETIRTPNLDRLARQGTIYTNFHVCSGVCSPSRAAVMTSRFPGRLGIHGHFARHDQNARRAMPNWMATDVPTYMSLLRDIGYHTGHYGKWHLGHGEGAPEPFAYGIDECRVNAGNGPQLSFGTDGGDGGYTDQRCRSSEIIIDEAISFIDRHKNDPFAVNVWLNDTHATLDPDEKQLEEYADMMPTNVGGKWPGALAIYYAVVTNADRQIGRLLDYLDQECLRDDTIFIFSADNGPEDIHISNSAHSGVGSSGPFRGRKRSLYEGGVRTPFILRWPGHAPAGTVDNVTPLSAVDLLPTFLNVAGAEVPADIDGEDMSDVFNGKRRQRATPLMWEWRMDNPGHIIHRSPVLSILEGKWKLLANPDRSRMELYDYLADPTELTNVAEKHPDVVDSLFEKVVAWQKTLPPGPFFKNAGSNAYPWPKESKTKIESWNLQYKGIVIEDPDYHIWGSSPIWGKDGKLHVFSARIPIATGFDTWWATSEIAHYLADQPEGPFSLVEILLKPGQSPTGSWDTGTQHNPTITMIDGLYILSYHASTSTVDQRVRSSQRIGMLTASDLNGPWQKLGKILEPPSTAEMGIIPPDYNGGTDNPSLIKHPDGRFYLYCRIKFPGLEGRNTYAVAIADKLAGPYSYHPLRVVDNPTYIEDPYVFVLDGVIYMLVTDSASKGGLWLRSEDGLSFDYTQAVKAFGPLSDYVSPEITLSAPNYRSPAFERPQLLLKDGVPTHLFAPCGANVNGGPGTACYLFEI